MLLVFVVFMALIVALNFWLYRPLLAFMFKREEMLKKDSLNLQLQEQKIKDLHSEALMIVEKARQEANNIKEKTRKESQEKYVESFERVKNEMETRFLKAYQDLKEQRLAIRNELKEHLPAYQVAIQEQISKMKVD